jgi:hypothetical protein
MQRMTGATPTLQLSAENWSLSEFEADRERSAAWLITAATSKVRAKHAAPARGR